MKSTIALLAIDFCKNVPEVTIRIMEKQITVRILISLNIVKGDYWGLCTASVSHSHKCFANFMNLFSSPDWKGHVSYCHYLVSFGGGNNRKPLTFQSFYLKPVGQLKLVLVTILIEWTFAKFMLFLLIGKAIWLPLKDLV